VGGLTVVISQEGSMSNEDQDGRTTSISMEVLFGRGDSVEALIGGVWKPGQVAYARMAGPDYKQVATYSVVLAEKMLKPGYTGTIVPAWFVRAIQTKGD
jgi:hypothetical protein